MTQFATRHRLEGLEPDNLLAFLALLGLLRSLEAADRGQSGSPKLCPRVFWDVNRSPLRPVLCTRSSATQAEIAETAVAGVAALATSHDFGERSLNYPSEIARKMLQEAARSASSSDRDRADLLASLMNDAVVKKDKKSKRAIVSATPFCLLFGGGQQYFLERLRRVPLEAASTHLIETLFSPWSRNDPLTSSFRWDPDEASRYALMAGDPTNEDYKLGTQLGANCLAAIGIAVLTLAPEEKNGRTYSSVTGGLFHQDGFSFTWPIWKYPATLSGIKGMLSHPDLQRTGGLAYLGVDHAMVAKKISVSRLMNFTRAIPLYA